jgi:heme/copper-type cytochrome/quinol oxidase subunit 2
MVATTFIILGICLFIVLLIVVAALVARYRRSHQAQPELPVTQPKQSTERRRGGDNDTAWAHGVVMVAAT